MRYVPTVQRPWVSWSRQRFAWTCLPVIAALVIGRIALLRATESRAAEIAVQGIFILLSLVSLYILFTWAAEYDRQNPRDH